mgnify:CR=1 FL=1
MSLALWLVSQNIPLYRWREFENDTKGRGAGNGFFSDKKVENVANILANSLSHNEAVTLLAREFDSLPSNVRVLFMHACNDARNNYASGNKVKGITSLNAKLGGKLLRSEEAVLHDAAGDRVNKARAGAMRKYAFPAEPKQHLSRSERRRQRKSGKPTGYFT